jgi:hypothetical protein
LSVYRILLLLADAVAHFNDKLPESKVISLQERTEDEGRPFLEQSLQEGARKLLQAAIENEVIDYIQFHKGRRDEGGQRLVVRNNVALLA